MIALARASIVNQLLDIVQVDILDLVTVLGESSWSYVIKYSVALGFLGWSLPDKEIPFCAGLWCVLLWKDFRLCHVYFLRVLIFFLYNTDVKIFLLLYLQVVIAVVFGCWRKLISLRYFLLDYHVWFLYASMLFTSISNVFMFIFIADSISGFLLLMVMGVLGAEVLLLQYLWWRESRSSLEDVLATRS